MPFDLKNADITYQYLVNKIFKYQIEQNIEIYVDDILIKSKSSKAHINDLKEAFATLRRYQMKLNLTKYAFRVTSEKFLGFIVSSQETEANPEKIQTI